MKTLTDHLAQYAAYHRDRRNIATHFVGIPMIVLAVTILLSRPGWELGTLVLSPAMFVAAATVLFYLALDIRFGLTMGLLFTACVWASGIIAGMSTTVWLACGIGLFVVGWILQFIGHYYEGRKPAFVDDLVGLAIGPLFVVAEWVFALGLRAELQTAIEQRVGATHRGNKQTVSAQAR